jgi:ribosomal protein S6--L-glutamate ligase
VELNDVLPGVMIRQMTGVRAGYHGSVRLLLLTARPELETNRRLVEAAEDLGLDPIVVDAARVSAVSGMRPKLIWQGSDVLGDEPGAVMARVGNWRPASVLAALEAAMDRGLISANPPEAIRAGRDHWQTVRSLVAAGLPVAPTVAGADPEALAETAARTLGFPVVVKQRRSRMGVGVIRCDAADQLEAVLDSLWRLGDEFVVQAYVASEGASLRLMVVGSEVVAAARFQAGAGEWRSNAARGAETTAHSPTDVERELALKAATALGLGQCGVDLLPGGTPVVLEVNPTPGFRHLEAASGVDVARALVEHAAQHARNSFGQSG